MGTEKLTMTIDEVLTIKRSLGLRCSFGVEVANIIKGTFPYGKCLKQEGRRVYQISKQKFYQWLEEEFGLQLPDNTAV